MVYIYKKHMRILIVIYLYVLYMYAKSKNDITLRRNALVNTGINTSIIDFKI